jgi:hypothetical protein
VSESSCRWRFVNALATGNRHYIDQFSDLKSVSIDTLAKDWAGSGFQNNHASRDTKAHDEPDPAQDLHSATAGPANVADNVLDIKKARKNKKPRGVAARSQEPLSPEDYRNAASRKDSGAGTNASDPARGTPGSWTHVLDNV